MSQHTPIPLPFPVAGLNRNAGFDATPDGTTDVMLNVRPHDALDGRRRGGRRPGMRKWFPDQIGEGFVQSITKGVLAKADFITENVQFYVAGYPTPGGFQIDVILSDGTTTQSFTVGTPGQILVGATEGSFFLLTPDRAKLERYTFNSPAFFAWDFGLDPDDFEQREIAGIAPYPNENRVFVTYRDQPFVTGLRLEDGSQAWQSEIPAFADFLDEEEE